MGNQKFTIISAQNSIDWVGRRLSGAHNGTIAIKEGELLLNEDRLTGGKIIVDMASIKILDIADPATNAQFVGHLASDDFFSADQHPEATLDITLVSGKHVEGNLTIKGISHPVGFDAAVAIDRDILIATGKLVIDRTKYGMKFRSGDFVRDVGSTLIHNDFELSIIVIAKATIL